MIVAEILLMALVFKSTSSAAREEREASGGGEPVRSLEPCRFVGGRWDTQSWTRSETCGFDIRFSVFFDEGFVVIIMAGLFEYGEEGR